MHVKKVHSFTLMELMVTMFITAILIGMSYFLFRTINFYFQRLNDNGHIVSERQLMRLVLRKDWENADSVVAKLEGLTFYSAQENVQWLASSDSLVRMSGIEAKGFHTGVAEFEVLSDAQLELVNFLSIRFSDQENETFEFRKTYPLTYYVR